MPIKLQAQKKVMQLLLNWMHKLQELHLTSILEWGNVSYLYLKCCIVEQWESPWLTKKSKKETLGFKRFSGDLISLQKNKPHTHLQHKVKVLPTLLEIREYLPNCHLRKAIVRFRAQMLISYRTFKQPYFFSRIL